MNQLSEEEARILKELDQMGKRLQSVRAEDSGANQSC